MIQEQEHDLFRHGLPGTPRRRNPPNYGCFEAGLLTMWPLPATAFSDLVLHDNVISLWDGELNQRRLIALLIPIFDF